MKPIITFFGTILIVMVIYSSFFVVTEGQQAILTQFGRPIGEPITDAGAHVKYLRG